MTTDKDSLRELCKVFICVYGDPTDIYKDHVVSVARALLERLDREEWQPIETAPKDRLVFLWGRYWSDGQGFMREPMTGLWNERNNRWECAWIGWFGVRPSHWMPLPAAPQPKVKE
jgi:hypothetical protein